MPRNVSALCLIATLIVGSGLRMWAAGGDMWIDEIWSLNQMRVAQNSEGFGDWIALFFHSNTHPLNSLYMRFIDGWFGPSPSPLAYRSLSLLSGIASLGLVAWWGWKRSPSTAIITTLLFAFSYPLINYSGEARGYGPMILAILGASCVLESYLQTPTTRKIMAFVALSLFGLLSHLLFVVVLAGLGIWALAAIYAVRRNIVSTAARLVPLFGLQLVVISAYSAVALNNMVRGGDCCPEPALDSIRIMIDWTFGLDANEVTSLFPLLGLTLLVIGAIIRLAQNGNHLWILPAIVVLLFPLITLIIETEPNVIHRYYLPSAVLTLLLVSLVLAWLWQQCGWKRYFALCGIVLITMGNINLLIKFSDGGRGQYSRVIQTIADASTSPQRISGFPNFSVGTLTRHHVEVSGLGERLQFVETKDEQGQAVDWFINGYLYGRPAEQVITRETGGGGSVSYTLIETYSQWGLSGDTWALYRRSL